jgi:hypothetical protein
MADEEKVISKEMKKAIEELGYRYFGEIKEEAEAANQMSVRITIHSHQKMNRQGMQ